MTIFAPGCFDSPADHDGLHAGHLALLKFAWDLAEASQELLVVAINDDASVRQLKGTGRPLKSISTRIDDVFNAVEVMGAVPAASLAVFTFDGDVSTFLYDRFGALASPNRDSPLVMVKGAEYRSKELPGEQLCNRLEYCPMVEGISTTILAEGT